MNIDTDKSLVPEMQNSLGGLQPDTCEILLLMKENSDLKENLRLLKKRHQDDLKRLNARIINLIESASSAPQSSPMNAETADMHDYKRRIKVLEEQLRDSSLGREIIRDALTNDLHVAKTNGQATLTSVIRAAVAYVEEICRVQNADIDEQLEVFYRHLGDAGIVDSKGYLEEYPDVELSGMDPLRHYILHGIREGREPRPHG